jgi:hypothetical protein
MRPTLPACLVLALAIGPLAGADIIVLENGQRISGNLDEKAEHQPGQVAINTGNGIIRISKEHVHQEDLGYETRRARLKVDDLKAVVDLGRWCRNKGMNDKALELLQIAVALPGVELPERALHARLTDELKGPEAAIPLYEAYRQDGGKDPETISRLETLEKIKAGPDAVTAATDNPAAPLPSVPNAVPSSDAVATAPAPLAPNAPKQLPNLGDGLETRGWVAEALQYSDPVEAKVVSLPTADGGTSKALEITFKAGKMDKAAVRRIIKLSVTDDSVLTFYAQNPGEKPINIAVAVKTGDKWEFHESPLMRVKPGDFQQLKFDLKASNFKSLATSWANTGKVANLDDVKELQLLIYGKAEGSLIIQNMGFPPKQDM